MSNSELLACRERIERVARAIYESIFVDEWLGGASLEAARSRQAAQAAIEAIQLDELRAENERLTALLNVPEVEDWAKGVMLEAGHQRERWGADHDAGKSPFDWFWLVGYLAQKAAASAVAGDIEKAKHHTISTGAALANWHLSLGGVDDRMRPGIDPVRAQNGGAGLSRPSNDPEREQAA